MKQSSNSTRGAEDGRGGAPCIDAGITARRKIEIDRGHCSSTREGGGLELSVLTFRADLLVAASAQICHACVLTVLCRCAVSDCDVSAQICHA